MQITASGSRPTEIETDLLIVPLFKDAAPDKGVLVSLNEATSGQLEAWFASGEASCKTGH